MHDLQPTNLPRRGAGSRKESRVWRGPIKEPGRLIKLGPTDAAEIRPSLLAVLGREGRASLFFLHTETNFSEEDLLRCALGLEREGLVSVEGRPDGNTSRRMVGLTALARAGEETGEGGAW